MSALSPGTASSWSESLRFLILGGGGGGRTAAGILERTLSAEGTNLALGPSLAFIDDRMTGMEVNGYPVIGHLSEALAWAGSGKVNSQVEWLIAFGTTFMRQRKQVFEQLRSASVRFANAIDPSAVRDRTAHIGAGNIIAAQTVFNPNARVGDNCFICVATTVDHDAVLGDHVYCSPGVNLAGGVVADEGALLGTNATVLPGVRIGAWAIVGAGAVVLEDVPAGSTVVGNPARIVRRGGSS